MGTFFPSISYGVTFGKVLNTLPIACNSSVIVAGTAHFRKTREEISGSYSFRG
jgi:hypothetical protein